jgi:Tfp pilus assembly protein FimT
MRNRFMQKLKSRKGVSLGEVLVSVLILSLATMAVVAGVQAALRVYNRVRLQTDAETMMSTAINTISADLYQAKNPTDITVDSSSSGSNGSGSQNTQVIQAFQSENRSYGDYYMYFENITASNGKVSGIQRVVCDENGDTENSYPVLANKTQTLKLHAKLVDKEKSTTSGSVSYENGVYTFTVAILNENESHVYASQTVRVRSMISE